MVEWLEAPDIKKSIHRIVSSLNISWIKVNSISYFRSYGSKTRAYARIWGLSKVWQIALKENPHYILEVISERFDKLNDRDKDEVLVHELTHIPKNFSGALMPHIKKRGKRNFHDKVKRLVWELNR